MNGFSNLIGGSSFGSRLSDTENAKCTTTSQSHIVNVDGVHQHITSLMLSSRVIRDRWRSWNTRVDNSLCRKNNVVCWHFVFPKPGVTKKMS